ncbi:hypothetical protein PHYPSEUDO_014443 [Phytophthora pseudosyringae]|uniref:Uncharacterized protein n=1 Tax=Phytophthora pseudosyringae TaxID=221518 RepID=A0A8T1V4B9_9STRA|nr:hypothetical protein PHYPSEUDO_014443 [Phytophthora pseudosyringae]
MDGDDVIEQVLLLKEDAATRVQTIKTATASKMQELGTAGQRLMQAAEKRVAERIVIEEGGNASKPKRHSLSTLLEKEQEDAAERRILEAQKAELHREELQLRRAELKQQRRQHGMLLEQMQHQTAQTETLMKLLTTAISKNAE